MVSRWLARACLGLACLGLAVGLGASDAFAQDPDPESESDQRARALNEEGSRLYEQGLYEEAVQAFKIAYSLSRRPLLLYNMAQAMERIGWWDEALAALEDYHLDAEDAELPALESRIAQLKARIEERDAAAAAAAAAAAQPVVVEDPRRGPPPGAWALFATGAVGVGVGSVFGAQALGARSDWTAACVEGGDDLTCPVSADEALRKDNRSSLIADIGWIVGAGGVSGGLIVVAVGRPEQSVALQAGPGWLRLGGRW